MLESTPSQMTSHMTRHFNPEGCATRPGQQWKRYTIIELQKNLDSSIESK